MFTTPLLSPVRALVSIVILLVLLLFAAVATAQEMISAPIFTPDPLKPGEFHVENLPLPPVPEGALAYFCVRKTLSAKEGSCMIVFPAIKRAFSVDITIESKTPAGKL